MLISNLTNKSSARKSFNSKVGRKYGGVLKGIKTGFFAYNSLTTNQFFEKMFHTKFFLIKFATTFT